MNRLFLVTAVLVGLFFQACSQKVATRPEGPDRFDRFHRARKSGDLETICRIINELHEQGVVKPGMTAEQMVVLLGPFDSGTGIYGHYMSGGYGDPKMSDHQEFVEGVMLRSAENYDKFYWLHFDRKDPGGKDETLVLKAWDECN